MPSFDGVQNSRDFRTTSWFPSPEARGVGKTVLSSRGAKSGRSAEVTEGRNLSTSNCDSWPSMALERGSEVPYLSVPSCGFHVHCRS